MVDLASAASASRRAARSRSEIRCRADATDRAAGHRPCVQRAAPCVSLTEVNSELRSADRHREVMPDNRSLPRTGGRAAIGFAALCLLITSAASAGGVIGNPKTGTTAPAPAGIYVVPAGSAGSLAAHDPAVRTLARYKSFRVVEAAPQDARALVAGGAVRRDDMRARHAPAPQRRPARRRGAEPLARRGDRRFRPATARCSSSCSSSGRSRTTGSRASRRPAPSSSATWPRTPSSSTPTARRARR